MRISIDICLVDNLQVPGLAEGRPSVLMGDLVYARLLEGGPYKGFQGVVIELQEASIDVAFSEM